MKFVLSIFKLAQIIQKRQWTVYTFPLEGQEYDWVVLIAKIILTNNVEFITFIGSSDRQCKVKGASTVEWYFTFSKQC